MAGASHPLLEEPKQFIKESVQLIRRCAKPDQKEFTKICQAVAIGFLVMGFIGYFVKLIHIPINNIIVGSA
ncbi:Protein transport protein Sec61 subunit gamma [Dimargaris cristalligena]|uniref:SecE/sec61-gamma protein n=1 Tax=Dimargaris cristalligena TaxID=215637 RepID=A0A4P9ZXB7_9FUNG|nr:Protein transport protein Sec61 subunit gamma [Dimargaris cristalligena]RKP37350.1 secE/sec61-gamma protein [Dimargaris cristalligena]|eukprot:RKP37350.1 secE/sec61-gamma protein [Dimargaris cristalligena]